MREICNVCKCTRSCESANYAKIVRSRDAQCNTEEYNHNSKCCIVKLLLVLYCMQCIGLYVMLKKMYCQKKTLTLSLVHLLLLWFNCFILLHFHSIVRMFVASLTRSLIVASDKSSLILLIASNEHTNQGSEQKDNWSQVRKV